MSDENSENLKRKSPEESEGPAPKLQKEPSNQESSSGEESDDEEYTPHEEEEEGPEILSDDEPFPDDVSDNFDLDDYQRFKEELEKEEASDN